MSESQPVNADQNTDGEAERRFDPAEWRGIIARYTGPDTLRSLRQVVVTLTLLIGGLVLGYWLM